MVGEGVPGVEEGVGVGEGVGVTSNGGGGGPIKTKLFPLATM